MRPGTGCLCSGEADDVFSNNIARFCATVSDAPPGDLGGSAGVTGARFGESVDEVGPTTGDSWEGVDGSESSLMVPASEEGSSVCDGAVGASVASLLATSEGAGAAGAGVGGRGGAVEGAGVGGRGGAVVGRGGGAEEVRAAVASRGGAEEVRGAVVGRGGGAEEVRGAEAGVGGRAGGVGVETGGGGIAGDAGGVTAFSLIAAVDVDKGDATLSSIGVGEEAVGVGEVTVTTMDTGAEWRDSGVGEGSGTSETRVTEQRVSENSVVEDDVLTRGAEGFMSSDAEENLSEGPSASCMIVLTAIAGLDAGTGLAFTNENR